VVVYVDAQYSHDGSKGVGIVIVDTHDNTRHIRERERERERERCLY
jgi:hypothetical protein